MHIFQATPYLAFLAYLPSTLATPTDDSSPSDLAASATDTTTQYAPCIVGNWYCFSEITASGTPPPLFFFQENKKPQFTDKCRLPLRPTRPPVLPRHERKWLRVVQSALGLRVHQQLQAGNFSVHG
jgi:hypothetical protein